jgi:hypothetical protein
MHRAGAQFLQSPLTLCCPESMNHAVLSRIKALHKAIRQQCTRLAWERECLICNFFHSQRHGGIIPICGLLCKGGILLLLIEVGGTGCPAPPSRIPACGTTARGSSGSRAPETDIRHIAPEPVPFASRELDAVAGSIRVGGMGWYRRWWGISPLRRREISFLRGWFLGALGDYAVTWESSARPGVVQPWVRSEVRASPPPPPFLLDNIVFMDESQWVSSREPVDKSLQYQDRLAPRNPMSSQAKSHCHARKPHHRVWCSMAVSSGRHLPVEWLCIPVGKSNRPSIRAGICRAGIADGQRKVNWSCS